MSGNEYSIAEVRNILSELYPHRKLVLSQFTFFQQVGVAVPTGSTFRRGRRCFKLKDILTIASVIELKENGIPLKSISPLPQMIRDRLDEIFLPDSNFRVTGYKEEISLTSEGETNSALDKFLEDDSGDSKLFWGLDLSTLAHSLQAIEDLQIMAAEKSQQAA